MNRLYYVYECGENSGIIVAAPSRNQARLCGTGLIPVDYIDMRARLVKGGDDFYDDVDTMESGISVVGKGTIEVDREGWLEWETLFKPTLLKLGRGLLFDNRGEDNE